MVTGLSKSADRTAQHVTTRHILGDHQNTFSLSQFQIQSLVKALTFEELFPPTHRKYIIKNIPDNNALKSKAENSTFTF